MTSVVKKDTRYIFKIDLASDGKTIKNVYYFMWDDVTNKLAKKGMVAKEFALGLFCRKYLARACQIVDGKLVPLAEIVPYKPSNMDKVFLRAVTDNKRRNSVPLAQYLSDYELV